MLSALSKVQSRGRALAAPTPLRAWPTLLATPPFLRARALATSGLHKHSYLPPPLPPPPQPPRQRRWWRVLFWTTAGLIIIPPSVAYLRYREPVVVTGRMRSLLLTREQELELGAASMEALQAQYRGRILDDPRLPLVAAVRSIGLRLAAAAAELPQPHSRGWQGEASAKPVLPTHAEQFRFIVIDSPDVNAVSVPGGLVVVYAGMLQYLDALVRTGQLPSREAGLAIVLAHEMSHVIARHGAEKLTVRGLEATLLLPFALAIPPIVWLALPLIIDLPFTRVMEIEADDISMYLLARACFPLEAAPAFHAACHVHPVSRLGAWLSTHPADATRERRARELATRLRPLQHSQCAMGGEASAASAQAERATAGGSSEQPSQPHWFQDAVEDLSTRGAHDTRAEGGRGFEWGASGGSASTRSAGSGSVVSPGGVRTEQDVEAALAAPFVDSAPSFPDPAYPRVLYRLSLPN